MKPNPVGQSGAAASNGNPPENSNHPVVEQPPPTELRLRGRTTHQAVVVQQPQAQSPLPPTLGRGFALPINAYLAGERRVIGEYRHNERVLLSAAGAATTCGILCGVVACGVGLPAQAVGIVTGAAAGVGASALGGAEYLYYPDPDPDPSPSPSPEDTNPQETSDNEEHPSKSKDD